MHSHHLAGRLVIGVDDDAEQEWCSAGSVPLERMDFLQENPGSHAVGKAQGNPSTEHRESDRSKPFSLAGGEGVADGQFQNLESVRNTLF